MDYWWLQKGITENERKDCISRLGNETCAIVLVQTGTQANQLASAIDRAGNNKFYRKSRKQKFLFF